jgi:hypothetical protein
LALLPPTVIGPISVCNSSIRVQGQNIGATVELFQTGSPSPIGGGTATWSDQVFPLNEGIRLTAGESITAVQTLGDAVSLPSPFLVPVQSSPQMVGAVACATHIFECGQSLALLGMVPGAIAEVTAAGVMRGRGISADGTARIDLSQPTQLEDVLVVTQSACGITGPPLPLPRSDSPPLTPQGLLPAPVLAAPVYACQDALLMGGVVDGALVTLTETTGSSVSALFPTSVGFLFAKPLTPGSSVSVEQTLPGCQIGGISSSPLAVTPTVPVPAPTIVGRLCAGSTLVLLTNLIPGAVVEIFQEGVSLGTATCSDANQYLSVPPLARKQIVQATQQLCSNVSGFSNQVKVGPAARLGTPVVQRKLFQCESAVRVSGLHPGAVVYVYSRILGAPIGIAPVGASEIEVQIAPLLLAGDQIYAEQRGCGQVSRVSSAVIVTGLPNQGSPAIVAPVGVGSSSVFVQNAIAGARVDVYANSVFRGTATATGPAVEIQISPPLLSLGDQIIVRQSTCEGVLSSVIVSVTGCQCAQVSKVPMSGATFLYTFNCSTPSGTTETVQVTASNDTDALQQAELGCDSEYGA